MNDKLKVLVRLDLECGQAEVAAQGHVTERNLQALYVVVKRANHLKEGLRLVVDVSHARVEPAAMEQLQACSESSHLPAAVDPMQSECRLSIVAPVDADVHAAAAFAGAAHAGARAAGTRVGHGVLARTGTGSRAARRARLAANAHAALPAA